MSGNQRGCGGCALSLLALIFVLPLGIVLLAPAFAARVLVDGLPEQQPYLREWLWGAAISVPLAVLLVRSVLKRGGRVRGAPPLKRWAGFLARGVVLLAAMNTFAFLKRKPSAPGEHVVDDGMPLFVGAALIGVVVLVVMALWDRRPRRVTVEEVRAAATEADRTLKRVRAENVRVRRQAEQVQARLVKLQARNPARPDVEFHSLRVFHRESYQCADTAHLAYGSAQTSLHTMSFLVRHARVAPLQLVVSKRARAEMRAAAAHLQRSHSELRSQVDQGLDMVRTLNANTSELKREIRDSCGAQGQQWFADLEERIEQAREERRAGIR
ncbi:hypothetical protein SK854_04210 [Lentzea sp. BCCO 10_0061]|uniref:Uncharacterized protein n=1 Tax=Lentzea sokolovensis TaxID=3095429 RepID=A0ABU4UR64_9PSEU|nr:hypothetical protein [Lentzea sp. BCCO 10_0061]MDX8141303.1 hypothetical protein [Lentzea sp. BCCO 10_0061]